jgi:hypothetical protein
MAASANLQAVSGACPLPWPPGDSDVRSLFICPHSPIMASPMIATPRKAATHHSRRQECMLCWWRFPIVRQVSSQQQNHDLQELCSTDPHAIRGRFGKQLADARSQQPTCIPNIAHFRRDVWPPAERKCCCMAGPARRS